MIAEVIFTGTELLLGQILNTNAQFLQMELSSLGIDLYYQVTVGDNLQRCVSAIRQAAGRSDMVIVGGGLGPTEDDISREALASALQLELVQDPGALQIVRRFFEQRNIPLSRNNLKQALVPAGARVLDNPVGTAPGIILERQGKTYVLLPGPPNEFKRMINDLVMPFLKEKLAGRTAVIKSRVLKFCGIGESLLDEKLSDLLKSTNPTLAPTANFYEVHLRITAKSVNQVEARELIDAMEERVRERLGSYVFGKDKETLPGAVADAIRENSKTIAVAEGISGGELSALLTTAPGAGGFFKAGIVAGDYGHIRGAGIEWNAIPGDQREKLKTLAKTLREQFDCQIGVAVGGVSEDEVDKAANDYKFFVAADIEGTVMGKELILLGGERIEVARRAATVVLVLLWRYLQQGVKF
ncbi:MAG: hypothetical protein VR69_05690 [Peptococcaceae bacterium BRH_c4b]|nr:MAG: hypothetical protein VR69_05690 [Peptococcaceae bacterium BRH_c4b]